MSDFCDLGQHPHSLYANNLCANRRRCRPARFDSDLYTIRVSLSENKGGEIDRLKTGFVVWDPKVIAQGPKIDFHDNYFHVAGQPQVLEIVLALHP